MRSVIFINVTISIGGLYGFRPKQEYIHLPTSFTYDISQSKNWGNNKPVIKSVIPYSSAEQAGIKKYDVIEEINGVPVTEISVDEIPQLLNPAGRNDVLLTISNLSSPSKQVLVKKDCKKVTPSRKTSCVRLCDV